MLLVPHSCLTVTRAQQFARLWHMADESFHVLSQDLHDVTPDIFLEMAGGVLHSLSYQQVQL